jgi:hypothetical protein
MGRHSKGMNRRSHSPKHIGRLVLIAAAFALFLTATAAFSQDSAPPPPPPDNQSAGPASSGPGAQEQSTVRAVRLSDVEGQVQVYQGDQIAFDQAEPNMPAMEGMRFVTGQNGRVEIEFEDGSVARVTPNSSVRLTQLRRATDGSTITQIDALSGLTYFELNGHGGAISVHFNNNVATPIDSAVFRIALDAAPNEVAVMHGGVHVDDGQGISLDVHPNQSFLTDPQQGGEFSVAQSIGADSWDQWNSDRDQALSQMEANETTARANSANPDDPAWNDLDYYGNWYNLPGYGQVWSPAGVDATWDPFGQGYWGDYSGVGYTWISGYPWGWLPYHCGAWDFVDGYGWIWIPGNCGWGFYGAGWYPYATVWRVPKGYQPPPRPRHGPLPRPQPVIAINRGAQYGAPFHFDHGAKPEPRALDFDGKSIAPLEAGIHPLHTGPVGEGYTAALVRSHPEMAVAAAHSPGSRTTYNPSTGVRSYGTPRVGGAAPARAPAASSARPSSGSASSGGGGHPSAPASSSSSSSPHH